MNHHDVDCAKRRRGWEFICTCEPSNPADKIHDRIAVLGKQRDAGLRMIGSMTVQGKDTAAAVAGVKIIDARIEELRNALGWL